MPTKFEASGDAEIDDSDKKYNNNNNKDETNRIQLRTWDPLWLRKSILFAFVALFLALAAAIVLVDRMAARRNGFPMTVTTNHYYWKYGPTAILVIVVALWRRVQYCVMVNQPWQQLSQKDSPQPAETTVLLDYVSPLQINSGVVALRNRHFAVTASISVFGLLKLVIVVSTMLFAPQQNTLASRGIQLSRQTRFGISAGWPHISQDAVLGRLEAYDISADPVWAYLHLRSKYADSEPPISSSVAFTNFSIPADIPSSSVTIAVDIEAFQPNISCESASVNNVREGLYSDEMDFTVESPSCGPVHVHSAPSLQKNCDSAHGIRTCNGFFMGRANCTGYDNMDDYPELDSTTPNTFQYFLTVAQWSPQRTFRSGTPIVAERATVLCSVNYSLRQAKVLVPAFNPAHIDSIDLYQGLEPPEERTLTDLSSLQLSEIIFSSLSMVEVYPDPPAFFDRDTAPDDTTALAAQFEALLTGVSHQVMKTWFLVPDNSTKALSGSVSYTDERLYTRTAAVWTMTGLFVVMACLVSLAVIPFTQQGVAPLRPAILASSAAVLSRSPGIGELLGTADHGAMRLSEIRASLSEYNFRASHVHGEPPVIDAIAITQEVTRPNKSSWLSERWHSFRTTIGCKSVPRTKRPWMMFASRRFMVLLTLSLPLASIVVLEVLYRKISEKHHNFTTPPSDTSPASYAINYGSTATVLLIATLFNSLDFSIATMVPFSRLALGNAPGRDTILFSIVENLPPIAFYKAFQHRHFGAASSLVCSTLGSILTIITSGLWVVNSSSTISRPATASIQAGWMVDFASPSITGNKTVAQLWDPEYHGKPNELPLIWNDSLVLPTLSDVELASSPFQSNSTLLTSEFTMPIVQPTVTCSVLPRDAIKFERHVTFFSTVWSIAVDTDLPAGCISLPSGNSTISAGLPDYIGEFYHHGVLYGAIKTITVSSVADAAYSKACPSFVIAFGVLNEQRRLTAMLCTQQLLHTAAKITYNSRSPSLQTPGHVANLELDTDTTTILKNTQSGASTLSFDVSLAFREMHEIGYGDLMENCAYLHDFFRAVLKDYANNHILNRVLNDNGLLIAEVNRVYQKYMTRLISLNFRTQNPSDDPNFIPVPGNGIAHGTATVVGARLEMSRVSKIVLQAVLGAMTLLGVLTYWLVDTRRVIPRNPYPIASSMAFFSGSWLVDELAAKNKKRDREGDEDENKLEEMSDRLFRLGWWWADTPEGTPTYTPEDRTGMANETDEEKGSREGFQAEALSRGQSSEDTLHNMSEDITESTHEATAEMRNGRNESRDGSQGESLPEGQRPEQRAEDTPEGTTDGTTDIVDEGNESRDGPQAEALLWGQRFGIDIHVTPKHGDEQC